MRSRRLRALGVVAVTLAICAAQRTQDGEDQDGEDRDRSQSPGRPEQPYQIQYTPHLVSGIPPTPAKVYGTPLANFYGVYEIRTQDWGAMLPKITQQLAMSLRNIPIDHFQMTKIELLIRDERCKPELLAPLCGGDPRESHPSVCTASGSLETDSSAVGTPSENWKPDWSNNPALLEELVWTTPMCVSELNTSVLVFPDILNNTYVTGWRTSANDRVFTNAVKGVMLSLHVVGVIPTSWARFFNAKFALNGSVPLPETQPGLVNESAIYTNQLNITITIFGIREPAEDGSRVVPLDYVPVCKTPAAPAEGCYRIDHIIYEHPTLTLYKLNYFAIWNKHIFVEFASAQPYPGGEFNLTRGPWPSFDWLPELKELPTGPWRHTEFPQKEWRYQGGCHYGVECDRLPIAPSSRYLHTAILYQTWNFEKHAYPLLCNEKPECGRECLIDLTCLGGDAYFQGNFFYGSAQFDNDDGGIEPLLPLTNRDCPRMCCRDRRLCMRKYDVLGYEVPFDATMLLVWGGKTYSHEKDPTTGRLVYHTCDKIPRPELKGEWRGCTEWTVDEMWRYDIQREKWDYIKTDSSTSRTTGLPVGYPNARYGHAAVLIEEDLGQGLKQMFMYMYGGLGPLCEGGACNDMWKYEIPWAPQAYYPKFSDGEWNRGNMWYRLKDCPFGARYRHSMVTISTQEFIFMFGGQGIGEFFGGPFRYRISTDMWDDLEPFGRKSLTRFVYDFQGKAHNLLVPTELYDPEIDVDCKLAWKFEGKYAHCGVCPECRLAIGQRGTADVELPDARVDVSMVTFYEQLPGELKESLAFFGGFRALWGRKLVDQVDDEVKVLLGDQSFPLPFGKTFYFDDTWIYDVTTNLWVHQRTSGVTPQARRGHSIIALRSFGNDTQLVMFGGHFHDECFGELWTIDLMRDIDKRIWTRIDPFIDGVHPPSMAYHTMVFSEVLNLFVLFGGLHWQKTDLEVTDFDRNVDRRCFKEALELPEKWGGSGALDVDAFLIRMRELCNEKTFCCPLTQDTIPPSTINGVRVKPDGTNFDLTAVSLMCRKDCEAKAFVPEFHPILVEGVWTYSPSLCSGNCSGHGICQMSQCVCELDWYGVDCSLRRCLGSTCYLHPQTKEQFCVDCSQHGRCIDGECRCFPGWGSDDCSTVLCAENCSSTPDDVHGVCVEDFPVNQCHCLHNWSGESCEIALCLNGCSGRGNCIDGVCHCNPSYHGEDCSVFVFSIKDGTE